MRKLSMIYVIATFFLAEMTKLCFLVNTKKKSRNFKIEGNYSGPTDIYTSFLVFSVQSMERWLSWEVEEEEEGQYLKVDEAEIYGFLSWIYILHLSNLLHES